MYLCIIFLNFSFLLADCPIPQHGENTVLTEESLLKNSFPDGTVITYECRNGYYKVSGTGTMNCVDGKWTDLKVNLPLPHFYKIKQIWFQSTLLHLCWYVLQRFLFVLCMDKGWYGKGDCVLVTCPIPTKVENGEHSWSSDDKPEYQQTIHFSCNTGYTMVGNKTIRCTKTGKYDFGPPQCIGKFLLPEANAHWLRCTLGSSSMYGRKYENVQILHESSWGAGGLCGWVQPPPYWIMEAFCPIPKGGENMNLTDESLLKKDFPAGTEVTYECIIGYEKVSGTGIMKCDDGKWTTPDIICRSESCLTCILHLTNTVIQHAFHGHLGSMCVQTFGLYCINVYLLEF
uniref:Complement factor H-like n=1 Tax=Xiphophorus maculatus TaxID=8083 RepID=A0A3B5QCM4_XIPMA